MRKPVEEKKTWELTAVCSYCGHEETYTLEGDDVDTLITYWSMPRGMMKPIQELFPNVPAWIRSGAIDKYSDGFCICPDCVKKSCG